MPHINKSEGELGNPEDVTSLLVSLAPGMIGVIAELASSGFELKTWAEVDPQALYEILEHPNWAPWLEASADTIKKRAEFFKAGQLVLLENGVPVASLSLNQIQWDGNSDTLPTWDQVAGQESTDYSETYIQTGNTLVLMSMNVCEESKGKQLPSKLVSAAKQLATALGIQYLIGSFRPSGFGAAKQTDHQLVFWEYVQDTRENGRPVDPWLRSLSHAGMLMIKEDTKAMCITVSIEEFEDYKNSYHPEKWKQVSLGVWECGEVGQWVVDPIAQTATYTESNVWGMIPLESENV